MIPLREVFIFFTLNLNLLARFSIQRFGFGQSWTFLDESLQVELSGSVRIVREPVLTGANFPWHIRANIGFSISFPGADFSVVLSLKFACGEFSFDHSAMRVCADFKGEIS